MAELVTSVPFCVAVKFTVVPAPPFEVMLMGFPEFEVMVRVPLAPTVTVADPLAVPEVAVMVTPDVVFAMPLIKPVLLTVTWLLSLLLQVTLLTLPVVPSLKFPVTPSCSV